MAGKKVYQAQAPSAPAPAWSTAAEVADAFGEEARGRRFLVTGAGGGLGREVVRSLVRAGAQEVIAILRPRESGEAPRLELDLEGCSSTVVRCFACDLASRESVRALAAELENDGSHSALHGFVLNAGISAPPLCLVPATPGQEGQIELQMQTNHLGHFLLTHLLLLSAPSLKRIIVVSSDAHKLARDARRVGELWDRWCQQNYHSLLAYSESKLANILFARELQKRVPDGVLVLSVNPGIVPDTGLGRHAVAVGAPSDAGAISSGAATAGGEEGKKAWTCKLKTVQEGAACILYCALAPSERLEGGAYYADCGPAACSKLGRNDALAERLYVQSLRACGLAHEGEDEFEVGHHEVATKPVAPGSLATLQEGGSLTHELSTSGSPRVGVT